MQHIFLILKMSCISAFSTLVIIASIIGGTIDVNGSSKGFDISITNVRIDNKDITKNAVNKNNLTFTTSPLQKKGDSSVLEYEIVNNSQYDASLVMQCTKKGSKSEYYIIEEKTPKIIESNSKEKANITVTLIRESLTDSAENFQCVLDVVPLEK